jgi:hypothetical protein
MRINKGGQNRRLVSNTINPSSRPQETPPPALPPSRRPPSSSPWLWTRFLLTPATWAPAGPPPPPGPSRGSGTQRHRPIDSSLPPAAKFARVSSVLSKTKIRNRQERGAHLDLGHVRSVRRRAPVEEVRREEALQLPLPKVRSFIAQLLLPTVCSPPKGQNKSLLFQLCVARMVSLVHQIWSVFVGPVAGSTRGWLPQLVFRI